VKGSRIHDPLAIQIAGFQGNALVPPAKYSPLAPAIDEYERLRACASGNGDDLHFHACTGKCFSMKSRSGIIAKYPHVAGRHAPVLTSHHCGRDLTSRQHVGGTIFNFGTTYGIFCESDERVCGVQANADKVNLGRFRHYASVNGGCQSGWALGCPKAFMNPARLVFQEGSCDGNLLLPAREDFAARQIEGGIFSVAAGITQQAGFRQGKDHPA
jgi:hypothetical protein